MNIYIKHWMLILKSLDHIRFVKVLQLPAVLHPEPPIVAVCLRASWTAYRVKERYLKYENAGDEIVGCTWIGILPTSCDVGISPVYFKRTTENSKDIDEFASLVFPIEHSVLISLSLLFLATFTLHEDCQFKWYPQLTS